MAASHEIATLYVSIVPETSKIAPGLKKEFNQIEKSGKSVGSRLGDVIGTGVKRAAQGAGLAAGAILGTALTKGMGRLSAIDTAEAKLTGLGHSASSVAGIMDDALASVKGTAFGLGEAGAAAATAVASGVKPGKDLQRTLKLMGDAAAIAGTDLNEMAAIFNKVSSTGKLQGDVLAQLGERGIPIIALLAETMGVASSEVAKLGAQGKIGFEDLQNAIEHGMGGAALAVGDTFVGSMDNAGAALARLGAEAMKPFFGGAITGVKTFTTVVDSLTSKVGPLAQELYDRLAPAAKTAGEFVEDRLVPGIRTVGEYAAAGMPTIQNFASSLTSMIGPAMTIGEALMDVAASLGVSSWEALLTVLDITAGLMTSVVVPGLNVVADVLDSSSVAAFAFGTALVGLTKGKAVLDGLQKSGAWMEKRAGTMADFGRAAKETSTQMQSFSRAHPEVTRLGVATKMLGDNGQTGFAKITAGADSARQRVTAFGDAHRLAAAQAKAQVLASTDAFTTIDRMGSQAWHGSVAAASTATRGIVTAVGGMRGSVSAAFTGMKGAATGLMNVMGGPLVVSIGAAVALIGAEKAAAADAKAANEALSEAVRDGEIAQVDFAAAVAGTTGELSEQGLAAAARIAKAELASFTTEGERQLGVVERTAHATAGFDAWLEKIPGMYSKSGKAINQHNREIKATHEEYATLEGAMSDLELPMSNLNNIVAEGGDDYVRLISHLRGLGDEGEPTAARLEAAREKIERLEEAARNMTPGFASARDAMIKLGDAANEGGVGVDVLHRAMQALGLAPKDAEGAMIDAAEAADEFAQSVKDIPVDLGQGLGLDAIWTGEGFNVANGNANELHGALVPLRDELYNVAVNGGDVHEAFGRMSPGLDELAARFNMTRGELDILLGHMGIVPDHIETVYSTNLDQTNAEITGVIAALDGIPEGETVEVDLGGDAREELERLGWTVSEELPNGNVEVTAQTEDARLSLREILLAQLTIDSTTAEPVVDLWAAPFDAKAGTVLGKLQGLDQAHPTSTADLDTMPLDWNASLAHGTLTGVDDRHAMASSDLDNALLDGNANTAHGTLAVLDGQRPKPIADLNTDGVRTGVDRATEWIRNFIREFANTVVNMSVNVAGFVRTVFSGGDGAATGGTIGALARGGSIDLVRGGSLPTSGPGTNVTDGFLGVDRGGMPIVRVDAGEEVINRKQAVKHRRLLKAINRGDPRIDKLPAFETGGSIGSREGLDRALREAKSSHDAGATYVWGGHSRTGSDCSGFVSRVAWTAQGVDPDTVGRMGNTDTMMAGQWPGFRRGKFGPFIVGVNSAHMAATIDGIPVESGGDVGGPSVGRGDGAEDPQFSEHWSMDHGAFSPPYSNAPVESSGTIYDGGTPTSPSVSGGNDRVVPLEDGTAQKVEKASQDENSIFYGTGADSWSDLGGNIAKTAVSGQLSSLLKVLGIPDEMPPLVQAGKTWMQKVKDDASAREIEKGDEAVAEQAEKELETVEPFDRGGIAHGKGILKKDVTEPERVLDPAQTRAFDELVAEITKSGVTSAVSAGAGALEAYVPGIGAVAGPAGDVAGWYAGEVAQNLMSTATAFAQDITGIGGAVMGGMVPITTPQVTAPAPVMPVMGGGGGSEIHFHVADMHTAMHKARQIQAREARGLVGTRR